MFQEIVKRFSWTVVKPINDDVAGCVMVSHRWHGFTQDVYTNLITWLGALWSPTDGADLHRCFLLVLKSSLLYIIRCLKFSSEDTSL